MTDAQTDAFGLARVGDNRPPAYSADLLEEEVRESTLEIEKRIEDLVAATGRVPTIEDEDTAARVSTLAGQLTAAQKELEKLRKAHKAPLDELVKVVQAHFKTLTGLITTSKEYLEPIQNAWLFKMKKARDEAAAKAAAEAAELAAKARTEEDTKAAEAKGREAAELAAPAQIKDDYGQTTSMRSVWDFEVEDIALVPTGYLQVDGTKVRRAISGGKIKTIPGLRIFEKSTAVTRSAPTGEGE